MELKNPADENATIWRAFDQIQTYKAQIPSLLTYNELLSGDDVAPLGLVCVRVVPRISATKLRFDFSFVWRTVEVLVGFPYSLYGSVKFSEHLTSLLRKNLPTDGNPIEMGEVSYTAQSLHMFTDEYGQIIARRIVNNASL
jgi:hypothetical protein